MGKMYEIRSFWAYLGQFDLVIVIPSKRHFDMWLTILLWCITCEKNKIYGTFSEKKVQNVQN